MRLPPGRADAASARRADAAFRPARRGPAGCVPRPGALPCTDSMPSSASRVALSRVLAHYFFGVYLLLLALCLPYLRRAWSPDLAAEAYALALALAQVALYLLPAFGLTQLARALLAPRREGAAASRIRRGIVYAVALVLATATAVAIEADSRVFEIFGFHLNGFVLNLVTTPGGIDSMGLGSEGVASFARAVLALAAAN